MTGGHNSQLEKSFISPIKDEAKNNNIKSEAELPENMRRNVVSSAGDGDTSYVVKYLADATVLNTNSADDLVERSSVRNENAGAAKAMRQSSQNYAAYDGPSHMILNEHTASSVADSEPSKKLVQSAMAMTAPMSN